MGLPVITSLARLPTPTHEDILITSSKAAAHEAAAAHAVAALSARSTQSTTADYCLTTEFDLCMQQQQQQHGVQSKNGSSSWCKSYSRVECNTSSSRSSSSSSSSHWQRPSQVPVLDIKNMLVVPSGAAVGFAGAMPGAGTDRVAAAGGQSTGVAVGEKGGGSSSGHGGGACHVNSTPMERACSSDPDGIDAVAGDADHGAWTSSGSKAVEATAAATAAGGTCINAPADSSSTCNTTMVVKPTSHGLARAKSHLSRTLTRSAQHGVTSDIDKLLSDDELGAAAQELLRGSLLTSDSPGDAGDSSDPFIRSTRSSHRSQQNTPRSPSPRRSACVLSPVALQTNKKVTKPCTADHVLCKGPAAVETQRSSRSSHSSSSYRGPDISSGYMALPAPTDFSACDGPIAGFGRRVNSSGLVAAEQEVPVVAAAAAHAAAVAAAACGLDDGEHRTLEALLTGRRGSCSSSNGRGPQGSSSSCCCCCCYSRGAGWGSRGPDGNCVALEGGMRSARVYGSSYQLEQQQQQSL